MISLAIAALAFQSPAPLSPESLRATDEKLASWHTRNTSSPGLTEAAAWIADQYRKIPRIEVETMSYHIRQGPRIPADKDVVEVIAKLAPNLPAQDGIVMMGGHLDSINMQEDPLTGRAPGGNDDGSAVAGTLDVAKIMATQKRSHPVYFIAFSGEEQGLLGSEAIAARAQQEGWKIDAVLSNDMVGNSRNLVGQADNRHFRVFSEESPKHNSRELARWIEWLNRTHGDKGFHVNLVFRPDRFGRGGDHSSFNKHGFTAVRFVEMDEEYSRTHTETDLPAAVDFEYLSHIAKVDLLALESLAAAPPAPTVVRSDRRQSHDAKITWHSQPGVKYMVYWRLTTEPTWTHWKEVGEASEAVFPKLSKDDNVFAVGAVGGIPIEAS